jgi:FAD/FMN-containing dehydrogenase
MVTSKTLSTPDLLARLAAIVGPRHVLTDPADTHSYLREWRDLFMGEAQAIVRPGSVDEVMRLMAFANEYAIPVVPQGGNTGLVGAQIPVGLPNAILVSLTRLDTVRAVDPVGNTITLDAGVILQKVQEEADAVDRLFPLSLGAQGSCVIGGNLSTNAGGIAVLAYGNTRDLTLGLEVVLPDGRLWNGLSQLRKDNTGYDLKSLFIGAEGTLGIITGAVLKLFPKPRSQAAAYIGLASPHDALQLLSLVKDKTGSQLTTFEIIPRLLLDFALKHLPAARDPMQSPYPWYVLAEISSSAPDGAAPLLETCLAEAFEGGLIGDAALSTSLEQRNSFFRLREEMSGVQKREGGSIKHDVSVPVHKVADFLDRAIAAVEAFSPGCRPVPFGHLGDGNIHFNVSQPIGADSQAFLAHWDAMNEVVHAIAVEMGGSISAEHGIGRLKRALLPGVKDPVALAMMRQIKQALDPKGILNPGVIL